MDTIHQILNALDYTTEDSVLATIIRVDGSSYRKAGTMMLLEEGGSRTGVLSGGCLEEDLYERSIQLPKGFSSKLVAYDMSSDDNLSWGLGVGCNGVVYVLLERIDAELKLNLAKVKSAFHKGSPVTMVKKLNDKNQVTDYLFLTETEEFGVWNKELSTYEREQIAKVSKTVLIKKDDGTTYIQRCEPKPRVFLFGAGIDTIPIAELASTSGFSVIVSDWRSALCNTFNFPRADKLIAGFPADALKQISFRESDSIIIATHHFQHDQAILEYMLDQRVAYIGLLGSSRRTERLLQGKVPPAHFFSPIGLRIGAEGPEEIAVAVIAEILQNRNSLKNSQIKKQIRI
ncbi:MULTISPECIES: XdhC family protein [Bacillus]|uniref:Xanthine dehydrogenase n=2 Tax=Bacillus TaxID=1386 RepID=A0A0M3R9Z0_9BACI|nr:MULTISPECIES: XdhC family protein [Bacillus]ALC82272.1 hypothetical protein AM592_12295 [Bacillus gobiensis]MBP1081128.1 xanthine/CO dehydrogenase XdhC/CoxF family maturation factor [Bacillus capparidis]MED1095813.1 XdhC family protein [Bacillus capparidis]